MKRSVGPQTADLMLGVAPHAMRPPHHTPRPAERIIIALFIAIPIACLVWMAVQWVNYGIDLPYFDDWRAYFDGTSGSFSLKYLFTPANDTLYAVGKFLESLNFMIFKGNSVVDQLLSMTTTLGFLLLLQWTLLKSALDDRLLTACAFAFTLLMLQSDSYWGRQNIAYHQAVPLIFILGAVYILVVSPWPWPVRSFVLFVMGILSGLTYTSGAFSLLALAATLIVCIAINRRAFGDLIPDGVALFCASVITVIVQGYVLVFVQHGQVHTGTPWSLPNSPEFWFYLFGKVGRSLMLAGSDPLRSLLVVLLCMALAVTVAIAGLRNVKTAETRHSVPARSGLITLLLFASVFFYLLMVAAGRSDLRPANISTPLQLFAFGFARFHFFWATLIWPWVFAGAIVMATMLWPRKMGAIRIVAVVATSCVVVFTMAAGVFAHASYFRQTSDLTLRNGACLHAKLLIGGPIDCPTLYPRDMTLAYANAVKMGASFIRYFPPDLLERAPGNPTWNVLGKPIDGVTVSNAKAETRPGNQLNLSAGKDVQMAFSVGQAGDLHHCLAVRVDSTVGVENPTTVQLFYVPWGASTFSEANSRTRQIAAGNGNAVRFLVIEPHGFKNEFRLDPVSDSQPSVVKELNVSCVLREPGVAG
ncbi:hypothetical protein LB577_13870 [Mesorhizobium sp. B283B1A]|uniref:hypothetical protein n=1 Tax=Mesorhizobium TaxID=68287 RepID=UPI001CD05854|nr:MULTISPECIES: hypothetical protein [Mesorhizobium]MCA0048030.1 hypothetical protein [Mesorhizobium sp. B283B1A]UQS63835.1 hypothetical protein M5D98_27605 [Mesorhizobium opportunistum]